MNMEIHILDCTHHARKNAARVQRGLLMQAALAQRELKNYVLSIVKGRNLLRVVTEPMPMALKYFWKSGGM